MHLYSQLYNNLIRNTGAIQFKGWMPRTSSMKINNILFLDLV